MNGDFMPSDSLLYHWVPEKDMSVLHFLYFFGIFFELSQFYLSCAARPRDPESLVALRDLGLALSTGLFSIP